MPIPVELLRFFDKFTPTGGGPSQADGTESVADLGDTAIADASLPDAIEKAAGPAAIANTPEVPLDIPATPSIPELSPEEKGDIGTVHHPASRDGDGHHDAGAASGAAPDSAAGTASAADDSGAPATSTEA
jgi:hypothetical protein